MDKKTIFSLTETVLQLEMCSESTYRRKRPILQFWEIPEEILESDLYPKSNHFYVLGPKSR